MIMKLSDIKIKDCFLNSTPKCEKVNDCRIFWNANHKQDRYIVVNHDNELIDGYIQYLILKEYGVEFAEVKISNKRKNSWNRKLECKYKNHYRNNKTVYIYGVHPNSKSTKERVWRVPNSWTGWEEDLLPGDSIIVKTKRGLKPIVITRIEWLNECPINIPVRKVVRKMVKE